jgi:hypothetical protein
MDYCPAREVCPYWKERYRNGWSNFNYG